MSKRDKSKIDLSIGGHKKLPPIHRIPVVSGTGNRDIEFPDDLIEETIKQAKGKAGKIVITKKAADTDTPDKTNLLFRNGGGSIWDILRPVVPPIPDEDYQALVNGADAIQQRMVKRQFDELMEDIFGNLEDTASWAVANMGDALKQPFLDHQRQIATMRQQVEVGLPKLIAELARRNPGVPAGEIIRHALKMLSEQLGPVLGVLNVYAAAIAQYRSGRFTRKLKVINLYMETLYRLWMNGDAEGRAPNAPPQIPLSSLQVGMRLLSMIGGPGLGTIPGAKGPVGLSLLMYPQDMLDWLSLALVLNTHEGGHQIFADIKGFEEEMQKAVRAAVVAADTNGTLKLVKPQSAVGRNMVNTRDLIVKMITDCIGEIEADVAGVLVNGPAFLKGMLTTFPALLVREGRVKDTKQLLRTSSVYSMHEQDDGTKALEFEPHPPDYIRAYIVAAMVEEIGYKSEADRLRKLADKMVGIKLPEALTWEDAEGRSRTVISIKIADIKAVAPVVAKALIRTKLTSLGGKSLSDLVQYESKLHAKVVAVKANLLAGKSELPKDVGSISATMIASAATLAYCESVQTKDADQVLTELEENVLKMLEALPPAA